MALKLLTLNIWNYSGPWSARCARIRGWIERLQPDVIGFQEVLLGDTIDQLAQLTDGLAYPHTAYAAAQPFWLDASLAFGNAIASRWPLSSVDRLTLPDTGDQERRVALKALIETPAGLLPFTSTHLHWKLHHGWVREQQVVALCDFARKPEAGATLPAVLVGDFNAEPHSTEIRYVTGLHAIGGRSVHFYDAWRLAGEGGEGSTWSNRNDYARASFEPDRRIDYIFAGHPAANGAGRLARCRVVCDDVSDGVWPSDHFGLVVELETAVVRG